MRHTPSSTRATLTVAAVTEQAYGAFRLVDGPCAAGAGVLTIAAQQKVFGSVNRVRPHVAGCRDSTTGE